MKKTLLLGLLALVAGTWQAQAITDNTVEIKYSGTTATITVASNISSYVTHQSNGAHVALVQSETVTDAVGEITYILSGTSTDGEFYFEGSYKATIELNGLTLTNPTGPAINIQNGKRIKVSAKNGTTNTLTDGANELYNGCLHCKGHTELKGKGTLNIVGKSRHGIYSKEYVELKNLTLNITSAAKDGIHCREYFLMESGTVNISGVGDDGIQVEVGGITPTGVIALHEDEDSGNFYQEDGTLSISNFVNKAIKADGTITLSGTTTGFSTTTDVSTNNFTTAITSPTTATQQTATGTVYDLNGHMMPAATALPKGIYVVKTAKGTKKMLVTPHTRQAGSHTHLPSR